MAQGECNMKLKKRWQRTKTPRWDDFFPKVPWWVRVKRFVGKPRTESEYNKDLYDEYLNRIYDP